MEDLVQIERLQKYLSLLRATSNWTVQEFADLLGVTRQTINNLEKAKNPTKMSKIQYLAIRSLFTYEVEKNDNKMLGELLYCLVDHPEKITDKERKLITSQAKVLSSAIKGGSTVEEINDVWAVLIGTAVAAIGTSIAIDAVDWLVDTIFKKD